MYTMADQPSSPPSPQASLPSSPQAPSAGKPSLGKEFRHIVRICNTDLDGNKSLLQGLRRIKGVNFMIANMACRLTRVNACTKAGNLPDDHIKRIDAFLRNAPAGGAPPWILNRRKDPDTGADLHLISNDLILTHDNDIKIMKKTRSYKGIRHSQGLPVRGQRTKSNFRKTKSKGSGGRLGVIRKKTIASSAPKSETKK